MIREINSQEEFDKFQKDFKKNVCIISTEHNNDLALECTDDNMCVLQDKFKTGYECSTCGGESYLNEDCEACKGAGKVSIGTEYERFCSLCCPDFLRESMGMQPGKKVCPTCKGKGALIIAPQVSEARPTSGVIKSVGPNVKHLKVEDRILFSVFAGTAVKLKQKNVIRIMHEHEAYCKMYGVGKLGDLIK